MTESKFLARWI